MSKIIFPFVSLLILAACAKPSESSDGDSRWLVIYRDEIAPNNEVVWLTRKESKAKSSLAFEYLSNHCDDLKELWEKTEGSKFFCSSTVFPGRAPKMIVTQ
jgi:uncharacterized lipoprotein YajG